MALGSSLVIIAVGAILRYAYTPNNTHGFNLGTIGFILMIIGIVGAIASVVDWMIRHRARTSQSSSVTSTSVASPSGAGQGRQVVERTDVDSQSGRVSS